MLYDYCIFSSGPNVQFWYFMSNIKLSGLSSRVFSYSTSVEMCHIPQSRDYVHFIGRFYTRDKLPVCTELGQHL